MMKPVTYSLSEIASITGAAIYGDGKEVQILHLLTDSRKAAQPGASLFFALTSGRDNGHKYINELYNRQFRYFVVDKNFDRSPFGEATFLVVSDPLQSLQTLAAQHREKFTFPVTGITGSNGKTIVKEWLAQLLSEDYTIVRSPKSYNSQIGVPLSVWQMNASHTFGIFEAGISLPGEMEKLQPIISPTFGIFTNIGEAHGENFQHRAQKISEKLKLFEKVDKLLYCRDYEDIDEAAAALLPAEKRFTWSRNRRADLQIGRISRKEDGTEIQGIFDNRFLKIVIPFTDDASVENAIHCWAFMLLMGYSESDIRNGMKHLSPVEMRLELREGINNCAIINDSYNSDPGSLSIALEFMDQQRKFEKKTVILSDILQTGRDERELYQQVAKLMVSKGVSRIIGIGEAIGRQADAFHLAKNFYPDINSFLADFNPADYVNEIILIKGARIFGFERIGRLLQQKAHETVLEVNLTALIHNLNYFRSKLNPGTMVMAMVKAFSYGSGSFEIAGILQFHRADYLAVAYADEGIELRRAGINLPIMVMNPEEQSYDVMIHYRLEPEIFSMRVYKLFLAALERNKGRYQAPYPVHIKLDTGMHRLGFEAHHLDELITKIKSTSLLKIRSIFSHLAGSDDPKLDDFTRSQVKIFEEMSERIMKETGQQALRHILNSAGASRFPEASFDMVRLGIGLYGIAATPEEQENLRNVSTLKTTISQIKKIPAGETVGYSRSGISNTDMTIATIPIGYADGLNRRLGNGRGFVYIKGKKAPTIGNICMDMTMIDITGITAREGDDVTIFGDDYPITTIASALQTIPYEVFTSISRRVKRIYYQE